jgi:peptidoglycan/LPS O-acetylase OafA/YrhL
MESLATKNLQPNNFDLLRLLAAYQVVCGHAVFVIMGQNNTLLAALLRDIPGVPVFFLVSGFLISASWERANVARDYVFNRAIRILPAYWAVFLVSTLAILVFHQRVDLANNIKPFVLWGAAQLLLLPQWNPAFLRGYGTGVVNGALWTIPVEISFYISVPILYWIFEKTKKPNLILLAVVALSFSLQYVDYFFDRPDTDFCFKALGLTPLPWIGIFALGILAQRNFEALLPIVTGRVWLFLFVFLAVTAATAIFPIPPLFAPTGRYMGTANTLALCGLCLAFAFTNRSLANRVLRRNDISYGMYLFHLPIANLLLAMHFSANITALLMLFLIVPTAMASWFIVEKPALGLRKNVLYQHGGRTSRSEFAKVEVTDTLPDTGASAKP